MQLRYLKSLRDASEGSAEGDLPVRVSCLAWSPNGMRLAAAMSDRQVLLFDDSGMQRDRFSLKPGNKDGARDFVIRGMEFSPDSAKLAIAQSDNCLLVYNLGDRWDDRKTVCNKFASKSPVTCACWPGQRPDEIVFGTAEGKVKVGILHNNKTANLFDADSFVTSVASGPDGHSIVSGHQDGAIHRYSFPDGASRPASKALVVRLSYVPYCLAWGIHIVAAGNTSAVQFMTAQGDVVHRVKFDPGDEVREFTCAAFTPSGKAVVMGNYNRFFSFSYNEPSARWERKPSPKIDNLYSITCLRWKGDGSRLVTGSMAGALDVFDSCLRRYIYRNTFEITFTGLSSVIVRNLTDPAQSLASIASKSGKELVNIEIVQGRFVTARTTDTIVISDMASGKTSEIRGLASASDTPRFAFTTPDIAIVYVAGELSIIVLGSDDVLGSCRTEHMSTALVSLRMAEGRGRHAAPVRRIAYLLDLQTIVVLDLDRFTTITSVNHDCDIDWLELNPGATILLFRDVRRILHLYHIEQQSRRTMTSFCNYAQWVPGADVIVVQNRSNLLVWYNVDHPDQMTTFPIKGDVTQIERGNGQTRVLVNEGGSSPKAYPLDEALISFTGAIDSGQYEQVVTALERLEEESPDSEAMWSRLSTLALADGNLIVAERCFVALGDMSKANYLRELIDMTERFGRESFQVEARLALLNGNLRGAEAILLSNGRVDEAIDMYIELHKWDSAIAIAETRGHEGLQNLRDRYFSLLVESGQEVKAGEVRERERDYVKAIELYVKGGSGGRAANIIIGQGMTHDLGRIEEVIQCLIGHGQYERCGEFMQEMGMVDRALTAYRDGHAYARAVDLCRRLLPAKVTQIEHDWGAYLVTQKQWDAASNHFIESGSYTEAINAAIEARQFTKAAQILLNIDHDTAVPYFRRIATHFANVGNRPEAEKYLIQSGLAGEAVQMHIKDGAFDDANRVAKSALSSAEMSTLYTNIAQTMIANGSWTAAERLFLAIDQPDRAIDMYMACGQSDHALRLIQRYRKDKLPETLTLIARQAIRDGKTSEAESYLVKGGQWKEAVDMYGERGQWDDAMRVARTGGGIAAYEIVACAYSRTMAPDAAHTFLQTHHLAERAVDMALERGDFQEAFRIANMGRMETKLAEIHLQYAMSLEDEGHFDKAEGEFILARKPREAIDMFLHQREWSRAAAIAQQHDPISLPDVYIAQGGYAEEQHNWGEGESAYINAGRPDLAIQMYRTAGAWPDAIRCAHNFRPQLVPELESAKAVSEAAASSKSISPSNYGSSSVEGILSRATQMLAVGHTHGAIDLLLSVTKASAKTYSGDYLEKVWLEAVKVAASHAPERVQEVVIVAARRLVDVQRPVQAAELLLGVNLAQEAINVYIEAKEFDLAMKVAMNQAPQLVEHVEKAQHGGDSRLDALANRGDWEQVYDLAKERGQLEKYLLMHVQKLVKASAWTDAVNVMIVQGVPRSGEHLVGQVAVKVLGDAITPSKPGSGDGGVGKLRSLIEKAIPVASDPEATTLNRLLFIAHLLCVRHQADAVGLKRVVAKIAISLLRYSGDIPLDKAFYEAGRACQNADLSNMAFVFFNRFVDICDMADDPSHDSIDNSDFVETDIPPPTAATIPEVLSYSGEDREAVREMVLETAMTNTGSQSLTQRTCESCSASTYVAALTCHQCRRTLPPCIITGYPVLDCSKVECGSCHKPSNRDDWNRFVTKTKVCAWCSAISTPFY